MEHDPPRNGHAGGIRVLVADNSRFHTQLLAESLKRDPDLQILSSDLDASSLVAASISQKIDVFVLSAFAKEDARRGFQVLQELRAANPQTRAVILLDSSKPDSILEAFRAGAKGVFDHQASSDMLCRCIRRIHEGQAWLSHEQMRLVIEALASAPKVRAVDGNGMNLLSKREVEVVRCLAEGLTNREIAERLALSQHTIKNYLFRIFDKLGVSSRIELLFMTLSQNVTAPPLLQGLLEDPADGCDQATFALCEKAAESGVVSAQLALASMFGSGRATDVDVVSCYTWYSVALDRLTRTKNTVKKAMTPAQVAEAERRVRERLKSPRIEPSGSTLAPSTYKRGIGA
jgi:two-component system, NarL family, nitrate/nitrite response regulator NarL